MYHKGELEVQARLGESTNAERNGRVVTNKIIPGAVNFIEKQPFFLFSSMNKEGEIFISVIAGKAGYLRVMDESSIQVDKKMINSNPYDPVWKNLDSHPKVGLLFIELSSRRRFRVNGSTRSNGDLITVSIEQAYPNCPKYIQQRHVLQKDKPAYQPKLQSGNFLDPNLRNLIQKADTFFIGSASEIGDLDASHRGGSPGFIVIENDNCLLIPDYKGNSMYNTLGNFLVNPQAGLLFIDFNNHQTLQLSGRVEILWTAEDNKAGSEAKGLFWKFFIETWFLFENLKGYEWNFVSYSPFNPSTDFF
ncbi:pyridoxamine 5'-phosphate oxidase family protein [Desertivirga brevis]|uniref:pyridoxamine 5'-phosphate oxidase family protein n=1 Tax=Desertivirga brevis TaxID=2810310 RepID=UPI001A974C36|nr:pyridoxamine 5'-phosphate oxidase family protein [Pedobacter sp. SYSU D00873]